MLERNYTNYFNTSIELTVVDLLVRDYDMDYKSRIENINGFMRKEFILGFRTCRKIPLIIWIVPIIGIIVDVSVPSIAKIVALFASVFFPLRTSVVEVLLHFYAETAISFASAVLVGEMLRQRDAFNHALASYQIEKKLIATFGGEEAFNKLPVMPVEKTKKFMECHLYSSTTEEVSGQRVTKGVDETGRRFISFYVQNRITKQKHVETLLQTDPGSSLWKGFGENGRKVSVLSFSSVNESLAAIKQLQMGTHPDYELVQA